MRIRTVFIFLAVLGLFIFMAGCVGETCSDSTSTVTPMPTTVTKYKTGDVIAKTSDATAGVVAIQSFDSTKDSYTIYDVTKSQSSQWVRSGNSESRQIPRTAAEKLYVVKIGSIGGSQSISASTSQSVISTVATTRVDKQDFTFTQIITYYNDDGSITKLTKNKLTKTMTMDIKYMYKKPDSSIQFSNEFVTELTCGVYTIMFDKTRLNELIQMSNDLKSQRSTITDDSPQDQQETVAQENPFDGYTVTLLKAEIIDSASQQKISECTITGPNKSDISIKYS